MNLFSQRDVFTYYYCVVVYIEKKVLATKDNKEYSIYIYGDDKNHKQDSITIFEKKK